MAAAGNGHERMAELLLRLGAEVNLKGSRGRTALFFAAAGGHARAIELLLQHGAEINLQNSDGNTALMCAAFNGHPATVLRLLRAGADTKLRSVHGKSALQFAKQNGHAACVEAFRQHIAEVTASRREAAAGGAGGAISGEAAAERGPRPLPAHWAAFPQRRRERLGEAKRRRCWRGSTAAGGSTRLAG